VSAPDVNAEESPTICADRECLVADGPLAWLTSLQDLNLNAVEIGRPFRLGLQGCIVDCSQDMGWQWTFGHGRKIVPEMLQRRGADDDAIIAFGVQLGVMNQPAQRHGDRIEDLIERAFRRVVKERRGPLQ
jgi:hypothetical protein